MSRLAADEKLCYYPIPEIEVDGLVKHLQLGPPTERANQYHILDPCGGEGRALKMIAAALGVPDKQCYIVELDKGRGEECRRTLPGANILAPCSLFSTMISFRSFSLVYCNPPFSDGLGKGSGRDELQFAKEAYNLLADHGVLVLVAPLKTFQGRDCREFLDAHFKDQYLYRFATPIYDEVVMLARKRANPLAESEPGGLKKMYGMDGFNRTFNYNLGRYSGINSLSELPALGTIGHLWDKGSPAKDPQKMINVWDVPPNWRPSKFQKANYLPEELIAALADSDNEALYRAATEPTIAEAPLPLAEGHVALLVASGALDGLIEVPERPELNHVMRGISRKVEYPNEEAGKCVLSEDGNSMRVTEVFSEQMDTTIRAVDKTFKIFTFELKPIKSDKTREYEVKIEEAEGDRGTVVIPLIREGLSDYIDILCGTRTIRFCFDTGAEMCSLSSDDLKGVEYFVTGKTMRVTTAGGTSHIAKEIVIARMRIGDLVARNVRCVVSEPTAGKIPALLGMNFLQVFDFAYSRSACTLTLTMAKKDTDDGREADAA
jgi:clan AA aspartic protease (TIGR02281 family)